MNNEEVNRYIHVEIMGNPCLHDLDYYDEDGVRCTLCKKEFYLGDMRGYDSCYDYCSDHSPRRLLNEVVAKVAEPNSYSFYEDLLFKFVKPKDDGHAYNNGYLTYLMLNATAEQIATACVEAHKAAKPAA